MKDNNHSYFMHKIRKLPNIYILRFLCSTKSIDRNMRMILQINLGIEYEMIDYGKLPLLSNNQMCHT